MMPLHRSVLLSEVQKHLNVLPNRHYIDCTLGAGGHTEMILKKNAPRGQVLAIELDDDTIHRTKERLARFKKRITVYKANFSQIQEAIQKERFGPVAGVLFDLGLSMDLIKQSGRGFTFQENEPLDMRLDTRHGLSAAQILAQWPEKDLADMIFKLGGERLSRRIAKSIATERKIKPIQTTFDLVHTIRQAVPVSALRRKIHFATKTFQALRMAVNEELEMLTEALTQSVDIVSPGGRVVVISFHSLEDGIVKHFFKDLAKEKKVKILTKKPIIPTRQEIKENPASRSAKLRVIEKL